MKKKTRKSKCILVLSFMVTTIGILIPYNNNYKSKQNLNTEKSLNCNSPKPQKIAYLTLDDGPSNTCNEILDLLKKYNIKATFFLIGNKVEAQQKVVKRISDEGHTIGLHTYTHNMSKIYSSHKIFIDEMKDTSLEIEKVTGSKPNIIRFPGGSNGHINKEFDEELHNDGYKIFDWNIALSDGINAKLSPDRFIREARLHEKKEYNVVFLLAHCDANNKNTCIALPKIIDYYIEKGYVFKPITKDTQEYYCKVKK